MNNITSIIMANHSNIKVEEWTKQGSAVEFNNANNQRFVRASIPAIEMAITYSGLTKAQFDTLRSAYETDHSETVIIDADDIHDLRDSSVGAGGSTWAFKSFKFTVTAPQVYDGQIVFITSVFFNYSQYQTLTSEVSTYAPVTSSDTSFTTVLTTAAPNKVEYEYLTNTNASALGQSVRHMRNKGGFRKMWNLSWHLSESQFLSLLTFYRKKGGILGQFGMPPEGANGLGSGTKTNAGFVSDSFKYERLLDNRYVCQAKIVELL
tara:strand:+ start:6765 stop:7556 length:792 start_codon:yes stop_codon:yes gene_type:complete